MTRSDTKKKYHKVRGVVNHLDSLYNRMWSHFVETPTESYYLLSGEKITPAEMDVLYPIVQLESSKLSKGKCLDGRVIL